MPEPGKSRASVWIARMGLLLTAGLVSIALPTAALMVASPSAGQESQRQIDFARDVQPILHNKCVACHNQQLRQAGLSLYTRAEILAGGQGGPAVVPGSSQDSLLIQRVTGVKQPRMPFNAEPLAPEEIAILGAWIDQGAQDARTPPSQPDFLIAPRRPALPDSTNRLFAHPIDALVAAYFQKKGLEFPPAIVDAVFARRVYLDLWGLLPTPEQLNQFLWDSRPDKRERLIEHLLSHKKNYSEHWISFWNDLLRNDEGVVYHGTRESITDWLLKALESNLSYDQFVQALLNPVGEEDPKGFLIGVNWRGDVSASQTPAMQAAQNSAQVFLGVNLKCASCHDSFVNRWKLRDSYGMASLFSEEPLRLVRCDVPLQEMAQPKFLFPDLGNIPAGLSPAERRAAAARLFTTPENGRFARTLVNRTWKKLFGRGLIEPVDDMEGDPWDADLLDWLASDFVEHGYDIQFLLRRILISRTYQLPALLQAPEEGQNYTFQGPLKRRLTAEQFADAISSITGEWRVLRSNQAEAGTYSRDWRLKSTALARALGRPIRDQVFTERNSEPTTLQALELVNGQELADMLHWGARKLLGELRPPPENLYDSGVMTSGRAVVDIDITGFEQLWLLVEDVDSYDRTRVVAGWANAELVSPAGVIKLADLEIASTVQRRALRAVERRRIESPNEEPVYETIYYDYAEAMVAPIPATIVCDIQGRGFTRFRAVVGIDESSMRNDIHPRIRFFVFAEEPDRRHLVRVKADIPVPVTAEKFAVDSLITRLYRHALGRDPAPEEQALARQFLQIPGDSAGISSQGLEDLLWSIFLSPEFQYIR